MHRSGDLRYYDDSCHELHVLVALLSSSTKLHSLHLDLYPSPVYMAQLSRLTTLRHLDTRWVVPVHLLAPLYVSRCEAERLFVTEMGQEKEVEVRQVMWERREFLAERVFGESVAEDAELGQQHCMDGREAFFAWAAVVYRLEKVCRRRGERGGR